MTFDDFCNIVSLICIIAGLLYCFFKYVETPGREYRYTIAFFLSLFLGEYYWTVYVFVMHTDPIVSDFVAYLGWNIAIVFLLLAAFRMRPKEVRRFFHPLILLPVILNIPQFYLYIFFEGKLYVTFGGLLNNIWQVGITTVTAVFCMQDLVHYVKNRKVRKAFPWFSFLVILFLAMKYGMWTSTCFSWSSELMSPYPYCSILGSYIALFFAYGVREYCRSKEDGGMSEQSSDLRPQLLLQIVLSLAIIGICAVGFFIADMLKDPGNNANNDHIIIYLFAVSFVVIFLVLVLLFLMTSRYRRMMEKSRRLGEGIRGRINFILTIAVTLALMAFALVYNIVSLYNSSVTSVYEDGSNTIKTMSTDIGNYLTLAETTLRVTADTSKLMLEGGSTPEEILKYLTEQTKIQSEQFDENFTGIYAYVDGVYVDGSGWVPPKDYDPISRDWYKTAVKANGEVAIVTPYVDAQTGAVVITFTKCISDGSDGKPKSVVSLDVIFNHIKEVAEEVDIQGKGYGMVVNGDGLIIAHRDSEYNGENVKELFGEDFLYNIKHARGGKFETRVSYDKWAKINNEKCTAFVKPVMDQWYTVVIVTNRELFGNTYSHLAVSILVSLITFCLISFFYYIGYRNEEIYGRKVEEMNLQVVSALASAIDAKDNYTNGHSTRVADYSKMIAERAGYTKPEQDEIYMMGLLHDVGKIGVPDEVINKPAKLNDEEFELIKKHPETGSGILERIKERPKLATGARWHHERYGGGGYPDGIAGEEIPEEARIIAVADAYDAMTSRRSYRDVMPQEKVRAEIEKGMGTQFDPKFAKIMIEMIDEDKEYTMHET